MAAGLGPVVDHLTSLSFPEEEVAALRADPVFAHVEPVFFDTLRRLRFEGSLFAVPEGTPVFPGEPILRLHAPLYVCTLLETRLLQLVSHATSVATRATRMVDAAQGRAVLDFGSRRAPGPEAAFSAARSAYIGGVSATTNALASQRLGITPMGTMSDTFLAAYGDDRLALNAYRLHFPDLCHLTLPDDDPVAGLARYRPFAAEVRTVRVDADDLDRVSRSVRGALDQLGMGHTRILGSGHLDEHRIRALVHAGAPIQLFAIGRALVGATDPDLRMAFRIAERSNGPTPVPVRHPGGAAHPGRKQVVRFADRDLLCLDHEAWQAERAGGRPLLTEVLRDGILVRDLPTLTDSRARRARELAAFPATVRDLDRPEPWPVALSDALAATTLR